MINKNSNDKVSSFASFNTTSRPVSSIDVIKDLRFEDKDLWSEDKDKNLKIGHRGQGLSSRTTTPLISTNELDRYISTQAEKERLKSHFLSKKTAECIPQD